jgi:hypothetical protein
MHRMAITERGIKGTSVYLIKVSYFPKFGLNNRVVRDDVDDDDNMVSAFSLSFISM